MVVWAGVDHALYDDGDCQLADLARVRFFCCEQTCTSGQFHAAGAEYALELVILCVVLWCGKFYRDIILVVRYRADHHSLLATKPHCCGDAYSLPCMGEFCGSA